jgi:hypothetical protein
MRLTTIKIKDKEAKRQTEKKDGKIDRAARNLPLPSNMSFYYFPQGIYYADVVSIPRMVNT